MADNRMYLRCKHCGQKIMLAACSGVTFYNEFEPNQYQRDFNEFLEKHFVCNNRECEDFGVDFDICYEMSSWGIHDSDIDKTVDEIFTAMTQAQKTAVFGIVGMACPASMQIFKTDLTPNQKEEIRELYGKFVLENNGIGKGDK